MAPSQNIMMSLNLLRTTNFLFLAVSGASLLLTLTLLHCWHVSVNWMSSACLDFMHKQWDAFFCATILLWVALDLSLFSHFPLALVTFHLFLPYFLSHGAPTLWFIHDLAPFEAGRFQSQPSSGEVPATNLAGWGPRAPTTQSKGGHRVAQASVSKCCLIANLGFSMVFKV